MASKSNSSRLLAYLIISSGTWDKLQWLLLIYSTCRLHPLNNGIHLNIVEYVRFHSTVTPFISIAVPLSNGNQIKIDTFLNAKFSRQITLKLALLKWTKWSPFWFHEKNRKCSSRRLIPFNFRGCCFFAFGYFFCNFFQR